MACWRAGGQTWWVYTACVACVLGRVDVQDTDYLLYGRLYLPTGRLDALYSTRLSSTLQALVAAISDPRSSLLSSEKRSRGDNVSNVMFSLQHDVGKWCSEYTYSAEDGMWGVRVLHNFGRLGNPIELPEDLNLSPGTRPKRVDEEEATGGGLKGRVSAGAEFYISAKERSAGGKTNLSSYSRILTIYFQSRRESGSQLSPMRPHHLSRSPNPLHHHSLSALVHLHLNRRQQLPRFLTR